MADVYSTARAFRESLLNRDRDAANEMIAAYSEAWQRIRARLDLVSERIVEARRAGVEISPAWLFQEERFRALLDQARDEINYFAAFADHAVTMEQQAAVLKAQEDARQLVMSALGPPPSPGAYVSWEMVPTDALTQLVGTLQDGSPLKTLLAELGTDAAAGVKKALVGGLALGQNPRVIGRRMKQELGGNLVRALTIARTEVMRSYNEAARLSYEANSDIVKGWKRIAAHSGRTCAACLALDGKQYPTSELMPMHPNDRCTMVPVTKTWEELGFEPGEDVQERETGTEWFERQSDAVKLRVLGKSKFQAYKDGQITIQDLAAVSADREWGPQVRERSLKEMGIDWRALDRQAENA